jgi:hypothetical protein
MSSHQWELLGAAMVSFAIVMSLQHWFLSRALERIIRDDEWASSVDDWSKLIRQDIAGVLLLLGVTNGLLAVIAAILVFR